MKTNEILTNVIYKYTGNRPSSIEEMRNFRIAENQKNFEVVYLIYAIELNVYYVIWKWTSMKEYNCWSYNNYNDAYKRYKERHDFAVSVN